MVQFLLHNTIGAWWCARHGIEGACRAAMRALPAGKAPGRDGVPPWQDDGTPAAGSFDGWPKSLKEFTMLDPCCGSGHFLVAGFHLLVPLRMHDEGLSAEDACDAVLRETCSASNSTPAAPRSRRSPWPWPRGHTLAPMVSPWATAPCRR